MVYSDFQENQIDSMAESPPMLRPLLIDGSMRSIVLFSRLFHIVMLLIVLLFATACYAEPARRVAIVIANSHYPAVGDLTNPAADARLIMGALQRAGFESITLVEDQTKAGLEQALQAFGRKADTADVALVYYAGHGIEINHVNYLIPVDAKLQRDRDAEIEAVKLDTILSVTENARLLRLVVLDACRNNPFAAQMQRSGGGSRGIGRGMSAIEPTMNSLVVYSAKAGTTAADGGGVNSPFARALARRIVEPGREINLLFRQVRDDVLAETGREQEPFTYGSLSSQEFYFIPSSAQAKVETNLDSLEEQSWLLCSRGQSALPCERYQQKFPRGRYFELSTDRIQDLKSVPRSAGTVAVPVAFVPASSVGTPEFIAKLGIVVMRELGARPGLRILNVRIDGPTDGRLLGGDLILRVNGKALDLTRAASQLLAGALAGKAGVQLTVMRDADQFTMSVRR